jgi:hypothetical protein
MLLRWPCKLHHDNTCTDIPMFRSGKEAVSSALDFHAPVFAPKNGGLAHVLPAPSQSKVYKFAPPSYVALLGQRLHAQGGTSNCECCTPASHVQFV